MEGLQKSSKTIKDELLSQTNLQTFKQMELKSFYYQEMIEGLQVLSRVERLFESIEFLSRQSNVLAASL